ncbi:hypothetical protein [Microbulbifer litoralis]|uniref:hypothetical protein n=1 Tax=Microbulbifer litoralis TaxID=2933965 RepID=UPI0020288B0C|nr:hypothetical protein [Microbulbifer sp. GX H0434]
MNETDKQLNLWANGRLPEPQRLAFEEKMATDPALAREAEFARALRQTLQSEAAAPPGELGLARLQKAVHKERRQVPGATSRHNIWKPVAIAACVVIAVQAAVLLTPEHRQAGGTVDLRPASGETPPATAQLQLVFDSSATAANIQTAVLSVDGSITAGPSALGIFRVALPEGTSAEAAMETLRAFEFVDEVIPQ